MHPAIFLDRDGVINENRAAYVRSWADVTFIPEALTALRLLRPQPHKIIIVTNQSAVGRGIISLAEAEAINRQLVAVIQAAGGRVDGVFLCPHAPEAACSCRKPQPGLLLQAAQQHTIDLSQSVMLGDALTDVAAGQAAGVRVSALLLTGRGKEQNAAADIPTYETLLHAITHLFPALATPS